MPEPLPWFRMYTRTLNNVKAQSLPAETFKGWVNILCCAAAHNGVLPERNALAFELRMSVPEALSLCSALVDAKLLERSQGGKLSPHDWEELQFQSDTSTPRVKKHRMKRSGNVSETAPEQSRAETEQSKPEQNAPASPPAPLAFPPPKTKATLFDRDSGWDDFMASFAPVAKDIPSSVDWDDALIAWKGFDPGQKSQVLASITRVKTQGEVIWHSPQAYLRKRIWEREPNLAAQARAGPKSKQSLIEDAFTAIERERHARNRPESRDV